MVDDAEIYLFGDLIAQSMSLHQGVLYNVEGPSYDVTDTRAPRSNNPGNFQWGQQPRRTRTNFLSAYDARTGQILWRIPAVKPQTAGPTEDPAVSGGGQDPSGSVGADEDIGFMAAPIGYGPLLLVPVNVGGSIYIYALDSRQQGKIVWRSYLTDEPAGGANYWAPIQLALEGSDLFAVCGSGALFVLEPATGMVRFARRYPRTGRPDRSLQEYGISAELMILSGWSEDIAIPYRDVILVLASDLNMIHAYDRQDGRLRWEAPLEAEPEQRVSYLIGIHNDMLFAGGNNELIAYDLKGEGRMVWTASWTARDYLRDGKSFGRGMLTSNAIYFPVRDSILKLDLKTGEPMGRVGVRLGFEGQLGNLFSDGEKIWAVCANRLLALSNVPADKIDSESDAEKSDSTTAAKDSKDD
jgi:outer membrane protein assembly factor BamB